MAQDNPQIRADRERLVAAQARGRVATIGAYVRLSGPGWLQSALTLGGGSLANSLYVGIFCGFGLLWIQPLAMILGIVMLAAIAYVTTATGERPFEAINRHVNPVFGWSWLLASLAANMVWALPQYSLATGVLQQNLLPDLLGSQGPLGDFWSRVAIVGVILVIATIITWAYDSGSWGIKLYESILKLMVAMIVACFVGVIYAMRSELRWDAILAGFVPDLTRIYKPSAEFANLLAAVPADYRDFWAEKIVSEQRSVILGATATAVGINMTFLFPYSILAKGWTKEFRGLAIWDLATGMLIPFVLATSCVVIAAASRFHPSPDDGAIVSTERLSDEREQALRVERAKYLGGARDEPLGDIEEKIALHLTQRDAFDLAKALAPLTGNRVANYVFGLGVLGMTLSTITILMLISGFAVCEMLGLPPTGWPHRLGCLAAATGVLGPFIFSGQARFYLAVPTSIFGMMLLPIAYWTFFLLMNQQTLLGKEMPRGGRRLAWNLLMIVAAGGATYLSVLAIATSPLGLWGLAVYAGLLLLAGVVHLGRRGKAAGKS